MCWNKAWYQNIPQEILESAVKITVKKVLNLFTNPSFEVLGKYPGMIMSGK
jgi:hypothetical protein